MALKRMDNVGIVVEDLGGAIDFFRELGFEPPFCRSASNNYPPSARTSAKPSGATLRCAPPALALRPHNLEGGQLFDADPGQSFGTLCNCGWLLSPSRRGPIGSASG